MTAWRFTDGDSDGEAWLQYPLHAHIYIDYQSPRTDAWRRVGMATRSWVAQVLASVGVAGSDPLCAIIPTLVIVPDGQGEELRRFIDKAVRMPGIDHYSVPVSEGE